MGGAEYEGTRPVRQPARTLAARRPRFEHARIRARCAPLACLRVVAVRQAHQLPENVPECPAHDVAGLIRREIQRPRRAELKSELVELEPHRASIPPVPVPPPVSVGGALALQALYLRYESAGGRRRRQISDSRRCKARTSTCARMR